MDASQQDEPMSDEIIVVTSPKAGSGANRDQIPRLKELLDAKGAESTVTTSIDEMLERIEKRKRKGMPSPVIVTAGGDGTIGLVADNVSAETPLVPMPLGTENLLARHFGHQADAKSVVETIESGETYQLDAGRANGRLFLVMVSCGFDADVVRRLHLRREGHISKLSYLRPIWHSMLRYRFPRLRVHQTEADTAAQHQGGRDSRLQNEQSSTDLRPSKLASTATDSKSATTAPTPTDVGWAMVFNLPCYGGGMSIEPGSVGNDGQLDLITFGNGSLIGGVRYVAGITLGRHLKFADVHRSHATKLRIESDQRVPYQLDGDYAGKLPLDIELLPARVRLKIPPTAVKEAESGTE